MALQEHDEQLEGVEEYESDGDYVEEELAGDEDLLEAAADQEVYTDEDGEEIEGDEGALGAAGHHAAPARSLQACPAATASHIAVPEICGELPPCRSRR